MKIKIGSRGSPLAKIQAAEVGGILQKQFPELETEFVFIKTSGDLRNGADSQSGGKGIFIKEIETALLDGSIDIAVHSMKDLPSVLPDGLIIGCVPKREDPSDCIVLPAGESGGGLESVKRGAKIGTGSLRRSCQILAARPDLSVEPLRGNVETRIDKMDSGDFDAIMLASAALNRLKLDDRISSRMDPMNFVPAPGQGALAVECGEQNTKTVQLLKKIECEQSRVCVEVERAFLLKLGGDCNIPAGCHARKNKGSIEVVAVMANESGEIFTEKLKTDEKNSAQAGFKIAEMVMSKVRGGN
ncbi:hydroxymethylbilane synthase [Candidatus Mycalebacterium sp.]